MAIYRLFVIECTVGTSGVLYGGVNVDSIKALESVTDQSGDIVRQRFHEMIQNQNKNDYELEAVLAGVSVTDFVRDRSINSSLYPGDRSRLQYVWRSEERRVGKECRSRWSP